MSDLRDRESPALPGQLSGGVSVRSALRLVRERRWLSRWSIASLILVTLAAVAFEGFGVAMLVPILEFIERGGDTRLLAESSGAWRRLLPIFEGLALPVTLPVLLGLTFALVILRQVFAYLRQTLGVWMGEGLVVQIRCNGFANLIRAELDFFTNRSVGSLVNTLTLDAPRTGSAVIASLDLLTAAATFGAYLTILAVLSPGMTAVALLVVGGVGLLLQTRIRRSERYGEEVTRNQERLGHALVERFTAVRVIKLAASEEREGEVVSTIADSLRRFSYDLARLAARVEVTVEPVVVLAGFVILAVAVQVFHMRLAQIGVFLFVMLRLLPLAKLIFKGRQNLAAYSASLLSVDRVLREAERLTTIRGGTRPFTTPRQAIEFEDVDFRYGPDEPPVLVGVSCRFPAGKMTALVGRSGAGKSTLVDLIPRLRVPTVGQILVDGVPIETFDLRSLRRAIAFVSQEGFLFHDKVANNIRYGRPEASVEEVRRAATLAYADRFIEGLPQGYETAVGERGTRLSGGERQRVLLARALLLGSPILILDEPTSALDSESEYCVQKALAEIRARGSTTIIVIAHRLSTIRSADQIIVLDAGRVVETGTHAELVHGPTWYQRMAILQGIP